MRSVFSDEKKLSIAAFSETLPDRLMLQITAPRAVCRKNEHANECSKAVELLGAVPIFPPADEKDNIYEEQGKGERALRRVEFFRRACQQNLAGGRPGLDVYHRGGHRHRMGSKRAVLRLF